MENLASHEDVDSLPVLLSGVGLKVTEHSETVVQNRLNPNMHFQSSGV